MKIRGMFLVLAVLLAFYSFACAQTEQLVLTTYYPSPVGSYSELQLVPRTAGACAAADEGKMYYDSGSNSITFCQETGAGVYGWRNVGGWTVSADNTQLYTNNTAWNVGIGTTNPLAKLHITAPGMKGLRIEPEVNSVAIAYADAGSYVNFRLTRGLTTINGNLVMAPGGNIATTNGSISITGTGYVFMGYEIMNSQGALPVGIGQWVTVDCSSGNKRVLGGGCWTNGISHGGQPKADFTGWICNYDAWVGARSHVSTAICANMRP